MYLGTQCYGQGIQKRRLICGLQVSETSVRLKMMGSLAGTPKPPRSRYPLPAVHNTPRNVVTKKSGHSFSGLARTHSLCSVHQARLPRVGLFVPGVSCPGSLHAMAAYGSAPRGSRGRPPGLLRSRLWNLGTTPSATFCWSQQVATMAQGQGGEETGSTSARDHVT